MIKTKQFYGKTIVDTGASLESFAATLGGIYSWGCSGNVRKVITKSGVMIGAQRVGPQFENLLVSSTTPQKFDGLYAVSGEKLNPVAGWAFFGAC